MTILGEGWYTPPVDVEDATERELDVADLRYEHLMATVDALRTALLEMPAPVVNVSEPDLSAVVNAVNGLRPGATAEEIGEAIVARLGGDNRPEIEPVLAKLVKSLDTLDFRLKGLGSGGGGTAFSGSLDVSDRAERQLGRVNLTGTAITASIDRTLTERMFAKAPQANYSLYLDTADVTYIYIVEFPAGTVTGGQGIRVVKDALGNPLGGVQTATNVTWATRSAASWAA